ncbi:MAG: SRPBCC family protein [Microbacterium ginsengisoli]|mgnify:CR=1 FL=1|nr:SRPBCC family protein [Microbacterium ginsengisoli]
MNPAAPEDHRFARHEDGTVEIATSAVVLFDYLDEPEHISVHMGSGSSSPMMGGGQMETVLDEGGGKAVGSHIVMRGRAFGFELYLDEVITERVPGVRKAWQTVEDRLVVIGAYRLGFTIAEQAAGSRLTVWIDYDLPARRRWLGVLGGRMYARWCVRQMLSAAVAHFNHA